MTQQFIRYAISTILLVLGIVSTSIGQEPYTRPEQIPVFPGCQRTSDNTATKICSDQKLMSFVAQNIKYPKQALDKNTTGTAVIKFIITKNGMVKDAHIVRNVDHGCGEEALRVVNAMNQKGIVWTPGQENGKTVEVLYSLPIRFHLP